MRPLKSLPFALLLALPLVSAACGGGGDKTDDGTGDDGSDVVLPDAHTNIDAPPSTACKVPSTIDATTALQAGAGAGTGSMGMGADDPNKPHYVVGYSGSLNADALPDLLDIQLWDEAGVFAAGVKAGTFPLTGGDASYVTCDACVRVLADYDTAEGSMVEPDIYQAKSGSITLTSVTTNLTGTLSNVGFTHIDYQVDATDNITGETANADGCTSMLASFSFDAPITALPNGQRVAHIKLTRDAKFQLARSLYNRK